MGGGTYHESSVAREVHGRERCEGVGRGWLSVPQHDDQSEQQDREGANWINRVASEIVFQPLHPDTGAPVHEERVIAVREEPNLHLEFYQRDVTDGMRSPWNLPVDVVSKSFQEVVKVAQKLESKVQPVIGLGFHSSAMEDVDHDALWLAVLNEVRQPGAHAPNCSVTECDGYIERKLSSTGTTQHVYVREEEWAVVYRDVVDGKESKTECGSHVKRVLTRSDGKVEKDIVTINEENGE